MATDAGQQQRWLRVGEDRLRLYTPLERALLRTAAAESLRRHPTLMSAAEQLAQEQQIPLHDAIAFVAIAKQERKRK